MRSSELAELSGLVAEDTGLRLADLAAEVDPQRAIVEVGSFRGKSASYLAEGARCGKGAHVWAVDPWDLAGNPDGKHGYARKTTRQVFTAQIAQMGLADQVTAIRGFSVDVAKVWAGPPIGLLFIDGSHEYEDVKADHEAWSAHLAAGAVVVFDDYGTRPNPGVMRYVNEIHASGTWDMSTTPLAIRLP